MQTEDSPAPRAKQSASRLGLEGAADAKRLLFFDEDCPAPQADSCLVAKRKGGPRADCSPEKPKKKLFN